MQSKETQGSKRNVSGPKLQSKLIRNKKRKLLDTTLPIEEVLFYRSNNLPRAVWFIVFSYLVDPRSIRTIQLICRKTRFWNHDRLDELKLDWVYNNVEALLGGERTAQLRNGSLTSISFYENNIRDKGTNAVAEVLKINTLLTKINLQTNGIRDKGANAIFKGIQENKNCKLEELNLYNNGIKIKLNGIRILNV